MKKLRIILSSIFIIILLQSIVNAETDTPALLKFQKTFLELRKDLSDFVKAKKDLITYTHDREALSDMTDANSIRGELSMLSDHISHLYDLLTIKDIMTIKSEQDFVKSLIRNQIIYMDGSINDSIEYINKIASVSNSPAFVSMSDQVKKEVRKLQVLLKSINHNNE